MPPPPQTVAVVGSGMAGLVAAYLLAHDRQRRFCVEIFETQNQLSLDSASFSLASDRVDIPMRALDDGFHVQLKNMYDHLGVACTSPRFLYPLSTIAADGSKTPPHFIHSSSNHRVPPVKPVHCGYISWAVRTLCLAVCYLWFTAACFVVRPGDEESLRGYLNRIHLPRFFIATYLLPLMSSVTTCPHEALLAFPAVDAVQYARKTYRQPHYTVVGGVQGVQTKLAEGQTVRLGATVTAVENRGSKTRLSWTQSDAVLLSAEFDHVVLAVTPNVVASIYPALRESMRCIPVVVGESVVHRDLSSLPPACQSLNRGAAEILHICSDGSSTESIHVYPSALVTNFPIAPIDPDKVLHRARLTRVLRTPTSRRTVNEIFASGADRGEKAWRNGDGNVWLVGAWCWDGMVLLEGCVVSAMRMADSLGVQVPWRR
ncbi:hypothetical protein ASPZODRAFT_77734 [Penicilliopsis zonata CBS 506.65]|uniref:Amine oxidase domain-containing protein n=1 Tax=Penicilliopsis zonata CBS 506.65 TaxID=1073090 RepID=A0A1L9S4K4_9EURO|nr:hypothetical protein ASPZODRAFT_77734 [Penicilliopsis zonata CBS 506.65]OJJ42088.1 hypothetical protein ASPZODRAFT_77734 [Penicilliopsis zonata CBS 506.65]